jgi:hypothetical protein
VSRRPIDRGGRHRDARFSISHDSRRIIAAAQESAAARTSLETTAHFSSWNRGRITASMTNPVFAAHKLCSACCAAS